MSNLHSHAFQRGFAGRAERSGPGNDSFWTWREQMYHFARRASPDDIAAIAAWLYVELLEGGYTTVGEFHYLHHQADGTPYDHPAELSLRVIDAASRAGMRIVHMPVLYRWAGFDRTPLEGTQRRFGHSLDAYGRLIDSLASTTAESRATRIGVAAHSLRAVAPEELAGMLAIRDAHVPGSPVHVHIAEQPKEVEQCIEQMGARPVAWLLDNHPVDRHWCLVHATHVTDDEVAGVARAGAVVGLCPQTEASLGDGIFPARTLLELGGCFGIGTDSHVTRSVARELRTLESGQRLRDLSRTVLTLEPGTSVGESLFRHSLEGGAQALGLGSGHLVSAGPADLVVLDMDSDALTGHRPETWLDAWIFAADDNPVRDVMVDGDWVVQDGRHRARDFVRRAYLAALDRILADTT